MGFVKHETCETLWLAGRALRRRLLLDCDGLQSAGLICEIRRELNGRHKRRKCPRRQRSQQGQNVLWTRFVCWSGGRSITFRIEPPRNSTPLREPRE